MKPIIRGTGATESERYLTQIAEKTFLNLWSYPNLYIDKKTYNNGDGKELCDMLVVCGDDIIIFSDKNISWKEVGDVSVSWQRWFRRAVEKSIDQIMGAERWIKNYPNRIFIDKKCIDRFPIDMPDLSRARFHGIAVAIGAEGACKKYNYLSDGSFALSVRGNSTSSMDFMSEFCPLSVGDVNPGGSFIHLFDRKSLDILVKELNTVSDFVQYLINREKFIRSGYSIICQREADLVALYLMNYDSSGNHVFPKPYSASLSEDEGLIYVDPGTYDSFIQSSRYIRKKKSDDVSFFWDNIIKLFTDNIISGTSVSLDGVDPEAKIIEPALRVMALEDRVMRRGLGRAFADALRAAEDSGQQRFTRIVIPKSSKYKKYGYIFMILSYPNNINLGGGYNKYRMVRVEMLKAYCLSFLFDNREMDYVIGIAVDASSKVSHRTGASEDLVFVEVDEWTLELEKSVKERRAQLDILRPDRVRVSRVNYDEYPGGEEGKYNKKDRRYINKKIKNKRKRLFRP